MKVLAALYILKLPPLLVAILRWSVIGAVVMLGIGSAAYIIWSRKHR